MPQKSRWNVPVPEVDIPTYLFGSPTAPLGDALAFADADDPETLRLTWTQLRLWSQRLAAGLRAAGLKEGDRVLFLSGNDVLFPVVNLGIIMAGGIYQSANPHSNARELAYQLGLTTPSFILASDATLACALEAAEIVGMGRERIFMFDDAPLIKDDGGNDSVKTGVKHWKHLLAPKEVGSRFVWKKLTPEESKSTTVYMIMTSGTTGLPKAAEASHYSIIANCVQTDFMMSLDPNLHTKELAAKNSRWLCTIPLYHGLALCYFCTISIARRVPSYIMAKYEIHRLLENIQRFRITELHLVPPIIVAMTKNPAVKSGKYDISSITKTFSCAAPLGPEPTLQYESLWPKGQVNVKQGLASTESCCNTIGWDPTLAAIAGSVGEPMPNCEIKLMDDDDNEVARGQTGEIWFRGPNIMKGYWQNKKATDEAITPDGWLRTGDVARQDEHGWYYVVDRKKAGRRGREMIKVKGVQVWPAELEALLLDHPAVNDAAVIGVRKDGEEYPRAYVVAASGASVSEDDIMQFVNSKVSTIKRLTGGVVFTEAIPKAPSGKILRRFLRDSFAKESKL
ncbi:uncharacterized protein N7515_005866 [Penicillium bovifimosum]|uniref:Uncharacterized protein n=1 Tax=Penicillium bovifimosum TaxID=126998 RepID=A0A9W9L0M5_9EURO|nr:uncharacterized protein N7515_005866 [Penicillium bovifimosum]KAJ5129827.1 hypothetical protein N7515_005866 [Penicillium bovifimosum]